MKVAVPVTHRFERTPDGAVWTRTTLAYLAWERYLAVFERVRVVARVRDVAEVPAAALRCDGGRVEFAALPYYVGPHQYAARAPAVRRAALAAVEGPLAVIAVGSAVVLPSLARQGRPYGLQVVGDPHAVFAPGTVRHPLRPLLRWWFTGQLRRDCARAAAVAYVTERALQGRYPPSPAAFATHVSDVELPPDAFAPSPRLASRPGAPLRLVAVGSLAQLYKAPDVLIDAVADCAATGLDVRVDWVGDGRHRPELEARAARRGVGERCRFLGQLPAGPAVRAALDRADLFVLPSRTEGLPRALVEAMARGLPCLGTAVGGVPELLAAEDLVPPGDVAALACRIREVAASPARLAAMSRRNLARARDYDEAATRGRREAFFQAVRERTEGWLRARSR